MRFDDYSSRCPSCQYLHPLRLGFLSAHTDLELFRPPLGVIWHYMDSILTDPLILRLMVTIARDAFDLYMHERQEAICHFAKRKGGVCSKIRWSERPPVLSVFFIKLSIEGGSEAFRLISGGHMK